MGDNSDACYFCGRRVYILERASAEGRFFHRGCFQCRRCGATLRLGDYAFDEEDGEVAFGDGRGEILGWVLPPSSPRERESPHNKETLMQKNGQTPRFSPSGGGPPAQAVLGLSLPSQRVWVWLGHGCQGRRCPTQGLTPSLCHHPSTVPRAGARGEIPHLEAHGGPAGQGGSDEAVLQSPGNPTGDSQVPSVALSLVPSILLLLATCWQVPACR
uniref:LIM zinc-binding domain-containing protein n=1 Tax=Malurus cyaneus samueli TaxID=2593467 RepID=A0A8C5U9E2_9PASS